MRSSHNYYMSNSHTNNPQLEAVISTALVKLDLHGYYAIKPESNKILITGYSGAGKTTLSRKLQEILQIQIINLDKVLFPLKELKYRDAAEYYKEKRRAIQAVLDSPQPTIIEGVQLMEVEDDRHTRIVLETGPLTSAWRHALSPTRREKSMLYSLFLSLYRNLIKRRKRFQEQRREVLADILASD
jgi:adenylate kinase family enzyme